MFQDSKLSCFLSWPDSWPQTNSQMPAGRQGGRSRTVELCQIYRGQIPPLSHSNFTPLYPTLTDPREDRKVTGTEGPGVHHSWEAEDGQQAVQLPDEDVQ